MIFRVVALSVTVLMPATPALAQVGGGGPLAQFTASDANKDGIITRDEYRTQRTKNYSQVDKNGDGSITTAELSAVMPNAQAKMMVGFAIGRFDTNKDKKISKAEWAAAPMTMFDRTDTNKDNKVTQDELKNLPSRR